MGIDVNLNAANFASLGNKAGSRSRRTKCRYFLSQFVWPNSSFAKRLLDIAGATLWSLDLWPSSIVLVPPDS